MTRIDFYLTQTTQKERFVCKLAEKAFRLGHAIYILAPDEASARVLDDLLWVFSPGSFVPHRLHLPEQTTSAQEPVLIGQHEPPESHHDVLISLWPQVPPFFSRFQRLLELVGDDDQEKVHSRERFRFYRDRGYPLETHPLGSA